MVAFGLTSFSTEATLDPAQLGAAAEAAGFSVLLFPDHTHVPVAGNSPYPGGAAMPEHYKHIYDPIVAVAYAATATTTLRVGIGVCLVPARDPIILARQIASLDSLSRGRIVLGVGAGWNAKEIENHGVRADQRWAVMRERVLAMKEIWTKDEPSFHSVHVDFDPIWSWPKPKQRPCPTIAVGGHGPSVLKRVVDYADEWIAMPSPGSPPLAGRIAELRALAEAAGKARPTVAVQVYGENPPDKVIEKYLAAGVDRIDVGLGWGPPAQQRQSFERLTALVQKWR